MDKETHPQTKKYKKLFNQWCKSHLELDIQQDKASIPPDLRSWFLEEEEIKIHRNISHGFFWQRLSSLIKSESPAFYRVELPLIKYLEESQMEIEPGNDYLAFFLRIQYESFELIEEPLAVLVDSNQVQVLNPDHFFKFLGEAQPAKIYFTEEEYEKRLQLVKSSLKEILADSIQEKQEEMATTLKEEFRMIREYYSHLLAKVKKAEDKKHYIEEQKRLESENIRKLHPSSLKLVASPEIIIALKFL